MDRHKTAQRVLPVMVVLLTYSALFFDVFMPESDFYLWAGSIFSERKFSMTSVTLALYIRLAAIALVSYSVYRVFYQDSLIGIMPKGRVLAALFFAVFGLYCVSFIFFEFESFTLQVTQQFQVATLNEKLLLIIAYLIMVPIYEELFFRGIMMGAILKLPVISDEKVRMIVASLIPSLLFMTLHTQYDYIWTYILLFLFATIVSIARLISGGVLLPILLHAFAIFCAVGFAFLLL